MRRIQEGIAARSCSMVAGSGWFRMSSWTLARSSGVRLPSPMDLRAWTIRQVYRPLTAKFLGTARRKVMVRQPSGIFRADPEMRKMAFMGTCVERPERIWPTYSSSNSGKLLLKKRVPSGAS